MAAEALEQYFVDEGDGERRILMVPEGAYKGWLPRVLYSYSLEILHLPFLRLLSFPVGGTSLGKLISLRTFHAVGNHLQRLPTSFGECSCIVDLDLSFNSFTEIPQPIFGLTRLEKLDMSHNDITEVSEKIGQLANLQELNLAGNILNNFPVEIAKCRRIQKLDLSGKFHPRGEIKIFPEGITYLNDLEDLNLSWQQIENIPSEFGNLRRLNRLNLKGNHLVHISPEISKCIRLKNVNLAGALRLCSVIPSALFCLEDLEYLNLSDNFFTEIPDEVCGLRHLTYLIIQRNAILRLPERLFQLNRLHLLELSENYLEEIPAAIGNMRRLTCLGLDKNRLTTLPSEICQVTSLERLLLGHNRLNSLPEDIYKLTNLKELGLENNQLTELPLLLDRLSGLAEKGGCLSLYGNSLRIPPQQICDLGPIPLYLFLKELRVCEARHRRKMILIGAVKAGKTSLRHALTLGYSRLTEEHERTWVLERHLWEPESRLRVQILDFGGHHIYQAAHHMFLTPDALHVLVFDLSRYRTETFEDLIGNWLDTIMERAPGATIILVGTHSDLCSKDELEERCADVIRCIRREEDAKLEELKDEIKRAQKLLEVPEARTRATGTFGDIGVERLHEKFTYLEKKLNTRSKVPSEVFVVSCAEGLTGVDELRNHLVTTMKQCEERLLPESWYRFLSEIQSVEDHVLEVEKAQGIFNEVMAAVRQSMISMGGSAELSLHMVLKYLHTTGEIVWYYENPRLKGIIFHRPETLIEMLRVVFRHDFESALTFDPSLGREAGLIQERFQMLKEDFVRRGLMTYELLYYSLLHFHLSPDALKTFISLMLMFDLCYEVERGNDPSLVNSSRILEFPWFFPVEPPKDLAERWPKKIPNNTFELRFEVEFPRKGPPYFFEKLSVKLQPLVTDRINWKNGVLARKNRSLLLVTQEYLEAREKTLVTVAARCTSELQELWWLLKQTRNIIMHLLLDWPFAQYKMDLICTHCLLRGYDDTFRFPAEVMELSPPRQHYVAPWCRKRKEDNIPVCFVYPLDMGEYSFGTIH